jgi:phosphoribosylformylglycinamidine cyclo-ligase
MLSTDGVGTKLELCRQTGRWQGVGFDLVAMCVDDLAAAGAMPLALVDYLAVGRLEAERDAAIVASVAEACRQAGVALVGGETAEHPGVMAPDQVDLAATALGVVEEGAEVTGGRVQPGDVVLALGSPNLRSNGFSLVRQVVGSLDLEAPFPGEDRSLGEVLCEPSLIYAPAVLSAVSKGGVHGMAHITGGGIPGNLVRTLPEGCRAVVDRSSWTPPAVFGWLRQQGGVPAGEMWRTFNLGVGFCLVVAADAAERIIQVLAAHGHQAWVLGEVRTGERGVEAVG